ncbi:MAG: transcriptional regulator, GntR family [Humibacillus sp.]|nr:transcriptional regulator, GntR family [Humibacillus sp.]
MGESTDGLRIDPASHAPPFEQVRTQLTDLIETGRLLPGDRLPTVRALAAHLGIATNTVARSYKVLEADGLVEAHSRAGTRVAPRERTTEAALVALADKFAAAAHGAGLTEARGVDLVRSALRARSD